MKRFALIFSALLLCVGFVVAQSGKGAVISSAAPEFDFGIIKEANGKVSHTFVIKNIGDAPLVITPWSDRLLAVLRRRASARRSDARDHQRSVPRILDNKGM